MDEERQKVEEAAGMLARAMECLREAVTGRMKGEAAVTAAANNRGVAGEFADGV